MPVGQRHHEVNQRFLYTEYLKFFQLWSEVKGRRVDTYATDQDLHVDSYVDGHTAYVILTNRERVDSTVMLNLDGLKENSVATISTKHVYENLETNEPVLEEIKNIDVRTREFNVKRTATMIIKISFETDVMIDEVINEAKYYATTYKQPIVARSAIRFNINNVHKTSMHGEAILRLGIGRDHGRSLTPTLSINGVEVPVPEDFRGDDQMTREQFFGVIEIPVPYDLISASNEIALRFPDTGGFVTSVGFQVFESSRALRRTGR